MFSYILIVKCCCVPVQVRRVGVCGHYGLSAAAAVRRESGSDTVFQRNPVSAAALTCNGRHAHPSMVGDGGWVMMGDNG